MEVVIPQTLPREEVALAQTVLMSTYDDPEVARVTRRRHHCLPLLLKLEETPVRSLMTRPRPYQCPTGGGGNNPCQAEWFCD